MEAEKDQALWRLAERRARFKWRALSFVLVNIFLWCVWYFTGAGAYPWPAWVTLGMGLGLAFNYFKAYHYMDSDSMAQKEYDKLKNKQP